MGADEQVVYVVRRKDSTPIMPGDQAAPGNVGNVLFGAEEVRQDRIDAGYARCLSTAKKMIAATAAFGAGYQLETITLKLALTAELGVIFVGDASVEAAIEVEIRRVVAPASGAATTGHP
jgi:hypothetical protein